MGDNRHETPFACLILRLSVPFGSGLPREGEGKRAGKQIDFEEIRKLILLAKTNGPKDSMKDCKHWIRPNFILMILITGTTSG
jgi:hypothetical protein